jgi:adenine-specific DNA methylase
LYKGYKRAEEADFGLFEQAKDELDTNSGLDQFIPSESIRAGWKTASTDFEGSAPGGGNVSLHALENWKDMFNERQLLCLSKLLRAISEIEDENIREYLILAFSDSLRTNTMMASYQFSANKSNHIFKSNSFDPPQQPTEGNIWGTEYGMGTFESVWDMVIDGVEYANSPTERHVSEGETIKSEKFAQSVGEHAEVLQGDMRKIDSENEFDAVITDPPYYHNVMYSELSDYFYVWLKQVLDYPWFEADATPRADSIVSNPAEGKSESEFENELKESFTTIKTALKDDGVLSFTYHHSGSESWGELLESLCEVGFEVTATYPVTADLQKLTTGEAVSFDIIVVARPTDSRTSTSWNSLRREIYRTARRTRQQLEENRDLSRGDIGVMEMGACFREYSKHHGKVQRDGEIMSAKEVVDEIYGIIQEASDIGVEDVFIDLLDTSEVTYDDVNKLCRGTNATPEDLKETHLYNQDDGFELGTWDNEKRQAYIQERVNGDSGEHLSNLDKLQFLRYRYEKGQAVQNYVEKWDVDDDLRELAGRLADVTDDDTYTRVLGDRDITSY